VTITAAGQELVDQAQAAFEAEIASLVADLSPAQRSRLSETASLIVAADARRRGIDIFNVAPASQPAVRGGRQVVTNGNRPEPDLVNLPIPGPGRAAPDCVAATSAPPFSCGDGRCRRR
jgi:hypothetical protein